MNKTTIFKPRHEEPGPFSNLDYIMLPFGRFYEPTKMLENIKKGDMLQFYNGPSYPIFTVMRIKQDFVCDFLCRMRYGCPWSIAFARWVRYAKLEGYGNDILNKQECYLVVYEKV